MLSLKPYIFKFSIKRHEERIGMRTAPFMLALILDSFGSWQEKGEKYGQWKRKKSVLFRWSFQRWEIGKWQFLGNKIFMFHKKEKLMWDMDFFAFPQAGNWGPFFFLSEVPLKSWIKWGKVFSFIKSIIGVLHNFSRKVDAQPNINHSRKCHFFKVNQTCKNHSPMHYIFKNQVLKKNILVRKKLSHKPNEPFGFISGWNIFYGLIRITIMHKNLASITYNG